MMTQRGSMPTRPDQLIGKQVQVIATPVNELAIPDKVFLVNRQKRNQRDAPNAPGAYSTQASTTRRAQKLGLQGGIDTRPLSHETSVGIKTD